MHYAHAPDACQILQAAQEKKKEQAKKGQSASGGKANTSEDAGDPVPSMIDLRVGHIIDGQ